MAHTAEHAEGDASKISANCFEESSQNRFNLNLPLRTSSSWIINLPEEVLAQILNLLSDKKDVKSLRLTCWRLCNAASHLLIPSVPVDISPASVARLVEISQHPTIGRGVISVKISLLGYSAVLANSFQTWLDHNRSRFSSSIAERKSFYANLYQTTPESRKGNKKRLQKLEDISSLWESMSNVTDIRSVHNEVLLQQTYEKYQRLCVEQATVLEKGKFVQTVAAVFAKMPFLESLSFVDHEEHHLGAFFWSDESYTSEQLILKFLLAPVSWKTSSVLQLGAFPTANVLVELFGAMDMAGCLPLQKLDICLSRPEDILTLQAPRGKELENLVNVLGKLTSFSVVPWYGSRAIYHYRDEPEESEISGTLLSAILNTSYLETLDLDFEESREVAFGWIPGLISFNSMVDIGLRRPWDKLTNVNMTAIPLHLIELQQFLNCLPMTMEYLGLNLIRLHTGSWAEALDMIRKKTFRKLCVINSVANESDDAWMADEELFCEIFEEGPQNKAFLYIMRQTDYNPLLRENWHLEGEDSEEFENVLHVGNAGDVENSDLPNSDSSKA